MTWDEAVAVLGADLAEEYRAAGAAEGPLTPEQRSLVVDILTETPAATRDAA